VQSGALLATGGATGLLFVVATGSSTRTHTENIQHFFSLVVSECNLRMFAGCVVAARYQP